MLAASVVIALLIALVLLYLGRAYWALIAAGALPLVAWAGTGIDSPRLFGVLAGALGVLAIVLGIPPIRRVVLTRWAMRLVGATLPQMGDTERIALEAGTVWWDGELFSGKPRWRRLLDFEVSRLTSREQAFLEGPVEELCRLVDDHLTANEGDLRPEVWTFLKRHGFFGMIIPEAYGGLGFTAQAHSAVVVKTASRSTTAAVTVMVPNSLGPAELLLHYGTDEQKAYYLPRLAAGDEVPCFALTGPEAGSDAAATRSRGLVCRGTYEGRDVLGMRLTWDKRYITLAPVATVIGLAFRLFDPDRLLGDREDLGITCALVPSSLPGVEIGRRHDPLGVAFLNGPTTGRDVFVPLDFIIGGRAMAGQGWRMLMESLAAGRSISLPALSVGAAETCARVAGAYASVRQQFDLPIGRFEGIEEPLARIAGHAYFMNAARVLTAGAVDAGERPSVVSAIVKAYLTEGMRRSLTDTMDIQAGAGISLGPRNILARGFMSSPIGITVEGANILTRSLIIFGQGAVRCHPHVRHEMAAIASRDLAAFDRAFSGHVGLVLTNAVRAFWLGLTGGRFARPVAGLTGQHLGQLTRMSAAFALVADAAMATLGGELKRRETISGRLADALAWMYLASAAVKRFWDEGRPQSDQVFLRWSCEHALAEVQRAIRGVLDNLPSRPAARALRGVIFPLGARLRPPSDALGARVARTLLDDRPERRRLTRDIFVPPEHEPGFGRLEWALGKVVAAAAAEQKIKAAVRARRLPKLAGEALVKAALEAGVITGAEGRTIAEAIEARDDIIQVDAFRPESFGRPGPAAERAPAGVGSS